MPIRKVSTPRHKQELQQKLASAYHESNSEQILACVKDHLEEQHNDASFTETTAASGMTRLSIDTPCMVFLLFGKFDCLLTKVDGSIELTTIVDPGLGFQLVDETEITVHPKTAVVVIQTP